MFAYTDITHLVSEFLAQPDIHGGQRKMITVNNKPSPSAT